MPLTDLFLEKVPEIFSFVVNKYGFEFDNLDEYRIIARKENMNLYFILDRGIFFSVEIEVTGSLGEEAIKDPKCRKMGASTMAECIDKNYHLQINTIRNENDLLSEMEEEARVLNKYCRNILSGDVSDWERIINCLLKR